MNPFRYFASIPSFLIMLLAVAVFSCSDDDEPPIAEVIALNPSSAMPMAVIAITGKDFSPVFSENKIAFNGKDALVLNASSTQINVVVPAGAETGPVTVTVKGKQAKNQPVLTIELIPSVINNISPISGSYNTVVTITGSNFLPVPSGNIVTFNGVPGLVESATATTLTVKVPARAGSGPLVVNGVAAVNQFDYIPTVYMTGYMYDKDGNARATYWKNGVPTIISGVNDRSFGNDIVVVNDDVYVAGSRSVGGMVSACWWKNGTEMPLDDEGYGSYAQGILAVGEDVYVAGYEVLPTGKTRAKYWKNGNGVNVTDGTSSDFAFDIAVSGQDIFVVGNSMHSNGNTVATYWKNGTRNQLTTGVSFAWTMFVSGTDVYTSGSIRNTGPGVGFVSYWKNSTAVLLGPGLGGGAGRDVVVSNDNVYVAGLEDNAKLISVAKYWKNGVPVVLTDGSYSAAAEAIDAIGEDVYAAGWEYNAIGLAVAKYWKNGVPINVSDGGYSANIQGLILR